MSEGETFEGYAVFPWDSTDPAPRAVVRELGEGQWFDHGPGTVELRRVTVALYRPGAVSELEKLRKLVPGLEKDVEAAEEAQTAAEKELELATQAHAEEMEALRDGNRTDLARAELEAWTAEKECAAKELDWIWERAGYRRGAAWLQAELAAALRARP